MTKSQKARPAFDLSVLDLPPADVGGIQSGSAIASAPPGPAVTQDRGQQIGQVLAMDIERIIEDPDQPRTEFSEELLGNLAEDIARRGIRQPIMVRPPDGSGQHKIINGARRYRAAVRAGLTEVPVIIEMEVRHQDNYSQVLDNTKRADLSALEIAKFIKARKDRGETNKQIAKLLAESEPYVTWHLSLIEGSAEIQNAFQGGRIKDIQALYQLAKLQKENPEAAAALLASDREVITRKMIEEVQSSGKDKEAVAPVAVGPDVVSPGTGSTKGGDGVTHPSSASPTDSDDEESREPAEVDSFSDGEEGGEGVKVQKLPYHNPELDEGDSGDGRMKDPNKIRKPLLLGEIESRPIKILLSKVPTTPGLAHIQWEDTMEDDEVAMDRIKLTMLTEMRVQEKQ